MPARHTADDTPPRRTPLSRQRVLHEAIALADESGLDAVTMRRLARRLDVEAMTLYHHVAGKDALVEGMLDLVVARFQLPDPAAGWRTGIRDSAISAHRALVEHPWAGGLLMGAGGAGPARLGWMEAILGTLRRAGFSAHLTHLAYHAIDSHIVGFTLWQTGYGDAIDEADVAAFRAALQVESYPWLIEHIDGHLAAAAASSAAAGAAAGGRGGPGAAPDDPFAFGLDLVLDGLERLRAGEARRAIRG